MPWPRLFEIEDFSWLPACWRDQMTDALQFLILDMKAYAPIVPELLWVMQQSRSKQIIDLCSGGGGPWLDLLGRMSKPAESIENILLTDLYPNRQALQRAAAEHDLLSYCPEPVDALDIPARRQGVRTLFSCFHHFSPAQATSILQDAVNKGSAIGVFEFTGRHRNHLLLLPFVTVGLFVKLLWKRPLSWSRLLWSYLLPVVPLIFWWDSSVSMLHSYTQAELEQILAGVRGRDAFAWEIGESESPLTPLKNTYLIGYPK